MWLFYIVASLAIYESDPLQMDIKTHRGEILINFIGLAKKGRKGKSSQHLPEPT